MKTKSLHLLASALLLAFASCTSDIQELNTEQSPLLKQIVMTTEDFEPEAGSRTLYDIADGAVKCTWASNDTVGVFPDKGAQAYFPMTTGAGTKKAQFSGGGWTLTDGSTYAAYYPFIGDMYLNRNAVPVNYDGQKQVGNGSMAHLGDYDYMVATPTAPEFGSALFMFKHLSALVQLKLTIPQPATLTSVKLVAENKAFAQEGKVDIMAETLGITAVTPSGEIKLDLQDVKTTEANQVVTLYLMLPPTDLSVQTLKAVIASDKGNQEIALESKNFQAGKAYALSGEMEAAKGSFEDGVVTLVEAGTMKQLLGSDCLNVASLKVVGPINGDDVRCLRQMLGASEFGESERGKLTTLDLSEASIVKGGDYYYSSDGTYVKKYYTSNNVLGYRIFYMCNNLLTIILPDNITLIDGSAFSSCSSLISINIPDCVTTIGEFAFSSCSSLTCIDIPNSVTSISENVFRNCSSLTSVKISKNITSIGGFAFFGCSSLINIDIPDSVTSIGEYAFADCSFLTSVILQDGVTSIGKYAFADCSSLTSVKIPDSVTSIGYCAFENCASLTSIDLPDNITSIGNSTFYHCYSLTSIDIPASVTSIGSLAFSFCPLTSVYITDISAWCKITFDGSSSNPLGDGAKLYLNNAELTELIIPEDIKKINDYAFYNCKSLTKVTVGDEVMTIGIAAFRGCSALTMVNIPANVTFIGKEAFHSCKSLVQVYSYAVTPPIINTTDSYSSFDATGSKTLHVLTDCSPKYNASNWKNYFTSIVEMD